MGSTNEGSSSGRSRRGLALALASLALAAGGSLVFVDGDPGDEQAAVPETQAPPVTVPVDAAPAPLVEPAPDADEPVARVARLLGPSVVQVETDLGQGSGVVYADGLIMTNHHVIAGTSQVQVRLADGRVIPAELVGSDQRIDIAVLRVGAVDDLPPATLALDDELAVGQLVVAIGSPFQLQQTVTSGVVSALNRPVPNDVGNANAMIQTDTAINPGNSGGALADRDGRVVGINTSGRTDGSSNSNIGIGFAVPIHTALATADRLVAGSSMNPGLLGISAAAEESSTEVGVLIGEVTPNSPAANAGIQPGDRIVAIDGVSVPSSDVLGAMVQSHFVGESIELTVRSDGAEKTVTIVLG